MKTLSIPDLLMVKPVNPNHGDSCLVFRSERLEQLLHGHYARPGLCLKVFDRQPFAPLAESAWGKSGYSLTQCIQLQNIFAWHGLASRVYDVARIKYRGAFRVAGITDFVDGELGKVGDLEAAYRVAKKSFMTRWLTGKETPENWVGGLFVDFQYFEYDQCGYRRELAERIYRGRKQAYQAVPELFVRGGRDMARRFEKMDLGSEDFIGKSVLDLGCSTGGFCREATWLGAKRVIGVDVKYAEVAYEVSNQLNCWNIDCWEIDLPRERGILLANGPFDIVFALAICMWVEGYAEWMAALCKDGGVFFLEGHKDEPRDKYEAALKRDFSEVKFLGYIDDCYVRPLFRCVK